MPLVIDGIRFQTLPSVWSYKRIFPALTYAQCVELEVYWDTYHGAEKPKPPIPYSSWVKYFTVDKENQPCRWVLRNIIKNWRVAKAKYHTYGLPKISARPDSTDLYEKMLQYHQNATMALAIAASPAVIIEANAHQPESSRLDGLSMAIAASPAVIIEANAHRPESSRLDGLSYAEVAADLGRKSKIGSSEPNDPKTPSLLNFARGKVSSPESPPEDASAGADNISRSLDHQVSDGNTGFMCKNAISKMVVALESENPHHPSPRWIYAEMAQTNDPIKVHPNDRLSNGIETHIGFPESFEDMDIAIDKNDFAIFDTSKRVKDLLKTAGQEPDPFLPPDVVRKRYLRLCTPGPEHMPYADDIDRNKLRVSDNPPAMTMNLRSSKRQRAENEPPDASEETPTLSGVLRSLDAYCTWAFGNKGRTIFQHLHDGGQNSAGDELRGQIKADKLPHVTGLLSGETEEQFYDRHAGRMASLVILNDAFYGILQGIRPGTGIPRALEFSMAALLNADATSSSVERQDGHLDKIPEDNVSGFAALTSISAAKDERANVGVVPKSASTIKKLLKLRRRFPEFCKIFNATLSDKNSGLLLHESIMQGKTLKEKQEAGWDFLCKQHMDQNPEEFKKLCPFEIELLPFEWLVFDSDLLHWGGPYRQSGHHNFRSSFKRERERERERERKRERVHL